MNRKSELAVWGAVVTGLEQCQSSDAPLLILGEFLGHLRRLGWHPADRRAIELSILELLGTAAGPYQLETAGSSN
jgi:hypothetical protein